ncbi:ATP10 protein-domain-containing protein [Apiospora arundinis]|uniref:ATP10 protein-domain-containing protein n=1 Tax=Apiospora arundinis TaxID=335852 RepID=A0ABR2J619_9PEZI
MLNTKAMTFAPRRQLLCRLCQSRSFSTSYRWLAAEQPSTKKVRSATTTNNPSKAATAATGAQAPQKVVVPPPSEQFAAAPRGYGKRVEEFTPVPLSRPIGMQYPPEEGQNTGIDERTWNQRRKEFSTMSSSARWSQHLERREELKEKFRRPYFRDWGNLSFHKGKTFYPPPRLFKGDVSLYFPNLYGRTLIKGKGSPERDTTPTLVGKTSVISIFSGTWADNQAKTFAGSAQNPALAKLLADNGDIAQHVSINVESDGLKHMLIRLFLGGIRKQVGEANWGKYFIVKNPLSDEIRENVGLLNGKVGYVYLVDSLCRIRWAGSGDANDEEREGLVKGLQRLIDEERKRS